MFDIWANFKSKKFYMEMLENYKYLYQLAASEQLRQGKYIHIIETENTRLKDELERLRMQLHK